MAELLLSLTDATVTFGGTPVFEGINLLINEGDRICLVGRNGAGKSTLLKTIVGDLELDGGKRWAAPGLRVGYLKQEVVAEQGAGNVLDYLLTGLPPEQRTVENSYLADIMLEPLELKGNALLTDLSGGQLRRAALGRALIEAPEVLLLDEPTNHLDLAGIEWMENYISGYKGALLTISHDRAFLANVSRKTFWLDRGGMKVNGNGYSDFARWSTDLLEQEARTLENQEKKLLLEEAWGVKGVTARRKRNVRRLQNLIQLREKMKSDRNAYNQTLKTISLDPMSPGLASKVVAEWKNVSKSFHRNGEEIPILKNFHMRIIKGDRIGILGKNGSGKSTYLRLFTKELEPDSGNVRLAKHLRISFFDQKRESLDPMATLQQTLCPSGGDYIDVRGHQRHVRAYLKDFMFDPKDADSRVSTLSGGQANRLLLARILANPGDVLILDEPTNDLDMDTLDMLVEILDEYDGTLLIVSHDRDFLDNTISKVLAFEGNAKIEGYMGGYSDYLEKKRADQAPAPTPADLKKAQAAKAETREAQKPAATKRSFKLQYEYDNLPGRMEKLEAEITVLTTEMADPALYMTDPVRFDKAARLLARARTDLDAAELRWLELDGV